MYDGSMIELTRFHKNQPTFGQMSDEICQMVVNTKSLFELENSMVRAKKIQRRGETSMRKYSYKSK